MNSILVVAGEPNSVFLELFFKSLKKIKINKPIILIASYNLVRLQMKKLNFNYDIKLLNKNNLEEYKLNNKIINLIDIDLHQKKPFLKITKKSNAYIKRSFEVAFEIIKKYKIKKFINGPINKKKFLNKKYFGMTEYISKKFNSSNSAMLIYNKNLSVCPITTHIPIKFVTKKINKKLIIQNVKLIKKFYKTYMKINPRIAILGLNPHCESVSNFDEDEKIIVPAINFLKKKNYKIYGPFSADTSFTKSNRHKFDVIVGMYHDQVLTPIKTLFEYDAINITIGLPFVRVSPDHGPNENMLGKNLSDPMSLIKSILFLDKN